MWLSILNFEEVWICFYDDLQRNVAVSRKLLIEIKISEGLQFSNNISLIASVSPEEGVFFFKLLSELKYMNIKSRQKVKKEKKKLLLEVIYFSLLIG